MQRRERLCQAVRATYDEHEGRYGSPRIHRQLQREGWRIGRASVEKSMKSLGLAARTRRSFRCTTQVDASHSKAPNTLNRNFVASRPDEVWVSDITYIRTTQGWMYLTVVIDLYSRSAVGWSLSTTLSTSASLRALEYAIINRNPSHLALHHSDQGCQYTSDAYRKALQQIGAKASMSRRGNCWDNAVAESFFSTLKRELIHQRTWKSYRDLRAHLFEYIGIYYNRQRLHSSLDYSTPAERLAEAQFAA